MVILFSDRKSKIEKEITEILLNYGGDYISDKNISLTDRKFTVITEYKKTKLNIKNGIAVLCDNTDRFINQKLPKGIIGICEDQNINALKIFEENKIPVITCGNNNKNTISISSYNNNCILATIQRTITKPNGLEILPTDLKIKLTKNYNPFSIMAVTGILLLNNIIPETY